jgi:hypothetical protein
MDILISSIVDFWFSILMSISCYVQGEIFMDNPLTSGFNLKIFGSYTFTIFDVLLTLLVMLTVAWLIWFTIKVVKRVFNLILRLVS